MSGGPEVRQRDRQQLAETLLTASYRIPVGDWPKYAAALLPVVDRIAAERAAEALEVAATACDLPDDSRAVRPWLAARAEAMVAGRQEEQP